MRIGCTTGPDAVHPHVCGEIFDAVDRATSHAGSPPRVWGNRAADAWQPTDMTVHPHVCGEISDPFDSNVDRSRFTPTCVGKSASLQARELQRRAVHPHVCGEIVRDQR